MMPSTQASNFGALCLYEKLGFVREEKMTRYYLNGGDAYRLKLYVDRESDKDFDIQGDDLDRKEAQI